jgi:hypothetical protein
MRFAGWRKFDDFVHSVINVGESLAGLRMQPKQRKSSAAVEHDKITTSFLPDGIDQESPILREPCGFEFDSCSLFGGIADWNAQEEHWAGLLSTAL